MLSSLKEERYRSSLSLGTQQLNYQVIEVPNADLLFTNDEVKVNNALILESFPNRDSIKYIDLYKMGGVNSFFRGTLRYKGFCLIMRSAREIGLLREEPIPSLSTIKSWKELVQRTVDEHRPDEKNCFLKQSTQPIAGLG